MTHSELSICGVGIAIQINKDLQLGLFETKCPVQERLLGPGFSLSSAAALKLLFFLGHSEGVTDEDRLQEWLQVSFCPDGK